MRWHRDQYLDLMTFGRAERPMFVFDTFGQFDGWTRLFLYMKRWGGIVRACRDGGVAGINAWGPWSPGCAESRASGT